MDLSKLKANNAVAMDTLNVLQRGIYITRQGSFSIKGELDNAINQAKLYAPEDFETLTLGVNPEHELAIEITQESTISAARELEEKYGKVCALNFASARKPGGGWLTGATAQEESITYASGLYPTIAQMKEMYNHNADLDGLYSDYMIYSPKVPVFRDDVNQPVKPFLCSFITAPAVNVGALKKEMLDLVESTMKARIDKILTVAANRQEGVLVLGAWGCGVFKNDPKKVATYFHDALKSDKFTGYFSRVRFAIYDKTPNLSVLNAFRSVLTGRGN